MKDLTLWSFTWGRTTCSSGQRLPVSLTFIKICQIEQSKRDMLNVPEK